jgi:hypothetical protein
MLVQAKAKGVSYEQSRQSLPGPFPEKSRQGRRRPLIRTLLQLIDFVSAMHLAAFTHSRDGRLHVPTAASCARFVEPGTCDADHQDEARKVARGSDRDGLLAKNEK